MTKSRINSVNSGRKAVSLHSQYQTSIWFAHLRYEKYLVVSAEILDVQVFLFRVHCNENYNLFIISKVFFKTFY